MTAAISLLFIMIMRITLCVQPHITVFIVFVHDFCSSPCISLTLLSLYGKVFMSLMGLWNALCIKVGSLKAKST